MGGRKERREKEREGGGTGRKERREGERERGSKKNEEGRKERNGERE